MTPTEPRTDPTPVDDLRRLLELAWGVIANAGEGSWDRETPEWKEAAERWRNDYHRWLDENVPHTPDRLAAAENQREALDVDDLALALELVAPIDWASFGEYLRFTEEVKKSAYRQIAERLVAKLAALKEQPR